MVNLCYLNSVSLHSTAVQSTTASLIGRRVLWHHWQSGSSRFWSLKQQVALRSSSRRQQRKKTFHSKTPEWRLETDSTSTLWWCHHLVLLWLAVASQKRAGQCWFWEAGGVRRVRVYRWTSVCSDRSVVVMAVHVLLLSSWPHVWCLWLLRSISLSIFTCCIIEMMCINNYHPIIFILKGAILHNKYFYFWYFILIFSHFGTKSWRESFLCDRIYLHSCALLVYLSVKSLIQREKDVTCQ